MRITVRFFASLRDMTGTRDCTLDIAEGAQIGDLLDMVVDRFPALGGHQGSWHFAVNQTHVEIDQMLQDGDRVAIFPYVAGG